jgi:hypothetical protein
VLGRIAGAAFGSGVGPDGGVVADQLVGVGVADDGQSAENGAAGHAPAVAPAQLGPQAFRRDLVDADEGPIPYRRKAALGL